MNDGLQNTEEQSNVSEKKLPPLPGDNDPFWRGAEKHVFTIQDPVTCKKHYLERVSGTEAECKYCRVGYIIMPPMEVKDGRIYLHGSRVG